MTGAATSYGSVAAASTAGKSASSTSTTSEATSLLNGSRDGRRMSAMDAPTLSNFVGFVEYGKSDDCDPGVQESPESKKARRKLVRATLICFTFMMLEIVGGYIAGSLAIMTDAAHLLSDVAGFLISLFALYLGNRKATPTLSYGFKRAEIVGAVLSVMLIWFLTGVLLWEAILRTQGILKNTRAGFVDGKIMSIIAGFGLVANVTLLFVLGHDHSHLGGHGHSHGGAEGGEDDHGHSHGHGHGQKKEEKDHGHGHSHVESHGHSHAESHGNSHAESHGHSHDESHGHSHNGDHGHGHGSSSLEELRVDVNSPGAPLMAAPKHSNINVTAAYVHAIGDLIQSAGVCIAGILIWIFPGETHPHMQLADPIVTFLFSIMVLISTYSVLKTSLNVLMEGVPDGYDPMAIARELVSIDGVVDVHHLHIWSLTVGEPSLSVHVVVDDALDMELALQRSQHVLRGRDISHSTIQVERRAKLSICESDQLCVGSPCDRYALECSKTGTCFANDLSLNSI